MRNEFFYSLLIIPTLLVFSYFWQPLIFLLIILSPIFLIGLFDAFQSKQTLRRNFPVVGRFRYLAEKLRPGIQQYFVETNIDGRPFNRNDRSVVYQRSKKTLNTTPFGTEEDVYKVGYEWISHSIAAKDAHSLEHHPRVLVGGKDCAKPYQASIFNVSAMSFGSLSKNAVMALNGGAKIGKFAHNTGEGGVSPYHLENSGDLIYQIGTGYFGCRADDGNFSAEKFKITMQSPSIKMVELKLSQGAKPGHGGILPAKKNTEEIAKIRGVKAGKDVLSPPTHKAFSTPIEMMHFIKKLRKLSGGVPIGFKLCIGRQSEFIAICKAMIETGIKPDFIAVDGGEGGTGAAPLEFSDSVGMPFREGLAFVYSTLVGFDFKKDIKIFAAGKIITSFDVFRAFALGADACYSARAMMMALGCIQARECNTNHCPTGVTTQIPELMKGLVVADKKVRVANYHQETLESFMELVAAAGLNSPHDIDRRHIKQRTSLTTVERLDAIYPYIKKGSLLSNEIPTEYIQLMNESTASSFDMV
ncbi:UNVERIFIED_CONTAM: hypothetical protein GTU68_002848 [Idotea baltica]|nr:hypothetical protein [Idotea baltica]